MIQNCNTNTTGLVITEEKNLTRSENGRLNTLEAAIQENFLGFVIVGMALAEINETRLYRTREGRTFDEYCLEVLDLNVRRAYQLIEAAAVMENVKNFSQNEMQDVDFITPQNEAQAKELARLKPEEQLPVWKTIVEKSQNDGRKITANNVKKVVCDFKGEKLKKVLRQTTKKDEGKDKELLMSPEFKNAWTALWEQVEKERLANWRYTSKSVVYERTEIILEAMKQTGIKTQRDDEGAK